MSNYSSDFSRKKDLKRYLKRVRSFKILASVPPEQSGQALSIYSVLNGGKEFVI